MMYNRAMDNDKFDKLFAYIVDMDHRMQDGFTEVKADIHELRDLPSAIGKRLDDNDDEQAARDAQWNRLIEWARKVSEKTGIPLPDL